MKRCPHCNFIFPDADELCDFDRTKLVAIAENEIDAKATETVEVRRQNRKALLMASVIGISLGLSLFLIYQLKRPASEPQPPQHKTTPPAIAVVTPAAELPTPAATPSVQTTANVAKPAPSPIPTAARAKVSNGPVSTSTESRAATAGKPMIIRLASGGKVEADEVWRTKEGVWYRRDGIVTLVKPNRVKAIVTQ